MEIWPQTEHGGHMPFDTGGFRPGIPVLLESPDLPLFGIRAWLESREDSDVVGWRRRPYSCVISNWLGRLGFERPATYGTTVSVAEFRLKNGQRRRFPLPLWAQTLEYLHDNPYRSEFKNRYGAGEPVRATDAIKFLRQSVDPSRQRKVQKITEAAM